MGQAAAERCRKLGVPLRSELAVLEQPLQPLRARLVEDPCRAIRVGLHNPELLERHIPQAMVRRAVRRCVVRSRIAHIHTGTDPAEEEVIKRTTSNAFT